MARPCSRTYDGYSREFKATTVRLRDVLGDADGAVAA